MRCGVGNTSDPQLLLLPSCFHWCGGGTAAAAARPGGAPCTAAAAAQSSPGSLAVNTL